MIDFRTYKDSITKGELKMIRPLVFRFNNEESKSKRLVILKMMNEEIQNAESHLLGAG
jgi:hypothetical protein